MDLIGKTPIVLLSPEEQIITKGSPGDRRDYFNKILSIISREYLKTLLIYQRLIKQRNFALRETRKSHTNHAAIIAWNEPVVSTGKKTLETKNRLESSLSSDIVKGRTIAGPHRDEYCFTFNGRLLRNFGSQGEHKLALVLIKMAEINTIKTATGKTPILMLDDFFAKLDFQRADGALSLLNGEYQTIITTTDIVDIEKHGIDLKSEKQHLFTHGKNMQSLKQVLNIYLHKAGLAKGVAQNTAISVWPDVVGEKISENTKPESVEHGTLTIRTTTPAWRQELQFQKQDIIMKLNKRIGKKAIKDIIFL